jgi:hypothetical protein
VKTFPPVGCVFTTLEPKPSDATSASPACAPDGGVSSRGVVDSDGYTAFEVPW